LKKDQANVPPLSNAIVLFDHGKQLLASAAPAMG
jgi:hypothetical protein